MLSVTGASTPRRRTPDVRHTLMIGDHYLMTGSYRMLTRYFDAITAYRNLCCSLGIGPLPNVLLVVGEYFNEEGGAPDEP